MKLTTLACLAALGLIGPATLAAAAPPTAQGPQAAVGRAGAPTARGSDRRRPSYAACNRASHQRGLRGGKRRRFLIRCKLGYDRPRTQQGVQPGTQQGTQQGIQQGAQPAVQPPRSAAVPAERKP